MRILVVTFGLVALVSTGLVAQAPAQGHTFVPAHKSRLSIDFGMKRALKDLPQRAPDCDKVKKHHHEPPPVAARIVELPFFGNHGLRTVPVAPCPVR